MSREGQNKIPQAWILADREFFGDSQAFKIKESRGREEELLRAPFSEISTELVEDAFKQLEALKGDERHYQIWLRWAIDREKENQRRRRVQERARRATEKQLAAQKDSSIRSDRIR